MLLLESAEDCVWRLLGEQPLGKMLEKIAGDNFQLIIKLYLKDYLHMVYKPATDQAEEFQVRKIIIIEATKPGKIHSSAVIHTVSVEVSSFSLFILELA